MVLRQQHILQSTVSVQVPLFNMPIYAGIDLARLGRRMAMLGEETAARQLLLGVATAYYGALSARELVDLHADTFRTAQRRLTAARARLAAEAGVRIDVARAELEVETARMNQQAAVFGFDRARQAIAGLLAMDELPMPVAPEDDIAPPSSADAVVERALENRSDLELQAYRIDLAEKNLWMAWTAFFPTLGLAWQLNTEITDPAGLGGRRNMWALVAVLGIPIYDEPRYGLLEQRRAEIRQAELNLEAARLELETEIRSAVREYESSLTTIETASRQVELAAEALRLAEAAFAAGAGTSLDVDSAQAAANAARVNLTVQKYQSRMALVKLLFLAGEVPGGE
jgi:outer membrane protein TolC